MLGLQFSTSQTILCMLFPLFFFILAKKLKNNSKVSSTPNSTELPKPHPIFGNLLAFLENKDRFIQWTSDIVTSSPNLTLLLNRNVIITANAGVVQHILKDNFSNYEKGPFFRGHFRDLIGDGIFNVDGEKWKFQRKISSHEFNSKSLRKFIETIVDSELSSRLIPILKTAAADKTVIDLQDILQRFAFDNVCQIAFGYDPAYLSPSLPSEKFAILFERAVKLLSRRFMISSFMPTFWKIRKAINIGSEKKLKIAINQVREFAKEIISVKKRELDHKSSLESVDLLSRFLSSGHLDKDFVADIVINFIIAGRDSTSAALTWFFWLLSNNPDAENEIMKEIQATSEAPNYDEVKDMTYTHASLCEAMRLYPPVPMDLKTAMKDDVLPDGTVVKKGMRVMYHPYAMGRVENVWGKDWAEFHPTRWLQREDEEAKWSFVNRDPYTYPVFQVGPRICLGKEMSFMQMKRVVAGVVRQFKVVPVMVEGTEPVYISDLTAKMKRGFPVRVETRE